MLHSALGLRGCVTAPHRAAALAGHGILAAGGSAIEAMVAMAAAINVVYPHMNGIGGDAFWLIHRPGERPIAISGAGRAAALATPERYVARSRSRGELAAIPVRGADAALLVPGAVATWRHALALIERPMPMRDLMAAAIEYAENGIATSQSQHTMTAMRAEELRSLPGFADVFLPGGPAPAAGDRFTQTAMAGTLRHLVAEGLDSFYRGDVASAHDAFFTEIGSPLRRADFESYDAERVEALSVETSVGTVFNQPPPTQGFATLMILGLFDRLGAAEAEGFDHVHRLVEATKRAYALRNLHLADPDFMAEAPAAWLNAGNLDRLAGAIDPARALPWPEPAVDGDTIWMGAADKDGTVVSFIQSLFWEFGSAVVCPATGVTFQNRGAGFYLRPGPNQLAPRKRPFHTLNPALAYLNDGRVMAFGTMGGEGQPQSLSAVFTRYAMFGQNLQQAITAPRWLLGKTWGEVNMALKLEDRFDPTLYAALHDAGHNVQVLGEFEQIMGHAGAVVRHPSGTLEGAADPRADGAALAD
jgi:gamma-glutamyltranspeptidase